MDLLDPVGEALDKIALAVKPGLEAEALLAVGAVRNVGQDVSARRFTHGGAVVTLVAEQGGAFGNGFDQRFSFARIMDLPPVSRRSTRRPSALKNANQSRNRASHIVYPIALEVKRLDTLFDIERTINGRTAAERLAARQEWSAPLMLELMLG